MTSWFHSAVLATTLAAIMAVGFASATIYVDGQNTTAAKSDLLPVVADAGGYITVETRQDGVSILNRIPVN